jgi:hypothetical protein
MVPKHFPIEQIIQATSGMFLTSMDDIYTLYNFMTCKSVYSHQIPIVGPRVAEAILKQHPQLEGEKPVVEHIEKDKEGYFKHLRERYGESLPLIPGGVSMDGADDLLADKPLLLITKKEALTEQAIKTMQSAIDGMEVPLDGGCFIGGCYKHRMNGDQMFTASLNGDPLKLICKKHLAMMQQGSLRHAE